MRDLRDILERERERAADAPYPATVFDRLLDAETWANSNIFSSILNQLLGAKGWLLQQP